jgi:hypothetical protein
LASGVIGSDQLGYDAAVQIAPADANSFINRQDVAYEHGTLPADRVRYVVIQDTNVSADDADGVASRYAELGVTSMPHFIIDRSGVITQYVPIDRVAHHAGDSTVPDANDRFQIGQERDDDLRESPAHAMDAWSVGVALIHEHNDKNYPNAQLNALDRLVAYIDQSVPEEPAIITKGEWTNGIAPGGQTGKSHAAPEDALVEDPSTQASFEVSRESSQAIEAAVAGSTVTGDFPVASYQSSRNHNNVSSVSEARVAAQSGGCSDGSVAEEEDANTGGEGIAKMAVELTGSATPDESIKGDWDEVPSCPELSKYVTEKNRVYPNVPGWADCGRFSATAVKASGADDDFPAHMNTAY